MDVSRSMLPLRNAVCTSRRAVFQFNKFAIERMTSKCSASAMIH